MKIFENNIIIIKIIIKQYNQIYFYIIRTFGKHILYNHLGTLGGIIPKNFIEIDWNKITPDKQK